MAAIFLISRKELMGLERWLRSEEHWLFLQRTWVQIPAIIWAAKNYLTPVPGDMAPYFEYYMTLVHLHTCIHNTQTHKIKINFRKRNQLYFNKPKHIN